MPPFVLMYHRVNDAERDPWQLSVSPTFFAEQIAVLADGYRPVTLSQLAAGEAPDRSVAVTFDDGYVDVLENAKPVLERNDCPATVFIPTGLLGQDRDFWWDELARIVFEAPSVPSVLKWTTESDCASLKVDIHAQSDREALHRALWEKLLPLSHETRQACLNQLAVQFRVANAGRPDNRSMTQREVKALSSDLIEIGSHTVTHPALPCLDRERKRWEIMESRRACAEIVGKSPTSFAYPNGQYDADSLQAVRDAGFSIACTVHAAPATPRSAPLELPRIHVRNWNGEEFARRLSRHFIDP